MKTIALLTVTLLLSVVALAQNPDLKSKKGVPIHPEAGDFSLSIDAVPFFQYLGNSFNGNIGNVAPDFNAISNFSVTGKKMLTDTKAIRGMVRIDWTSTTDKASIVDDLSQTLPPAYTEDKYSIGRMGIDLGAAFEYRRGNSRVQGIYGYGAILSFENGCDKYTYGNQITSLNTNPSSTDFNENTAEGFRVTKVTQGTGFGLAAWGFAGVEYFFAPKISIGGEIDLSLGFESEGTAKTDIEYWNPASETVTTETYDTLGGSAIFFTQNPIGGMLSLNFYF